MRLDQIPGSFFGPATLVELLRHRAEHQTHETAYIFLVDGESEELPLTYGELDRQARAIGAWLKMLGLAGERALLLYPAGLEFVAAFYGCLYAGVVAVPAYPPRANRSLSRIQAIVADAGAKVALTTETVLDRVRPVLEQSPDLQTLTWLATDQVPPQIEDDWIFPAGVNGSTLAFLQYTSGSTGTPKGVMLSHANLLHNSALISYAYELTRSGSGIFWLPSYHDMGLIGGITQPLYVCRPNVLMSPMSFLQKPLRWLQAISKYRGTTSGGPNFAYELCVRKISPEQRAGLDLSSWNVAFNGAEPIRAQTLDEFVEAFGPCGFRREAFYPCYGLAEATLIVSGGYKLHPPVLRSVDSKSLEAGLAVEVSGADEGARTLVSCGHNLPDQRIAIVDPETLVVCPDGKVGEIWVAGPSVAQGYWKRPDESERTFRAVIPATGEGPFLRTGDLGFIDGRELFVTGRLKDLIIVRGLNHYPQDIELTVEKSHTALRLDAGAAFMVETEGQEKLVVVQEIERRQTGDVMGVLDAIRRQVAQEHELLVEAVVLIKAGTVPKTSSGKIQRHACRDAFLQGTLEVVADWYETGDSQRPLPVSRPAASARSQPAKKAAAAPPDIAETPAAAEPVSQPALNGHGVIRVAKQETTTETVLRIARELLKERAANLTMASTLAELGVDSLGRLEFVYALEEHFGARFPEEVAAGVDSIENLVAAVDAYLVPQSGLHAPLPAAIDIPADHYRFDRFEEYLQLRESLQMLDATGLPNPFFKAHEGLTNDTTVIGGRELINFSSFNYIGMSGDPEVAEAAKQAIDRYGTSVSASRLVSGEKVLHRELERALAEMVGVEDALILSAGHGTNETTIGHLFGAGDLLLHDALAHNSIVQGCKLSGAKYRAFQHNDWLVLDRLLTDLRPQYRRVLVAIEGTYSMDGDIPDLPKFIEVKKRHKVFLYVDEAHSIGVLGARGRGIGEHFDVNPSDVDLWMGTLSKALGSCGGYIAGNKAVIEYLKYTAPGFVFATGISPANTAAALAAIRLLEQDRGRLETLRQRSELFLRLAKERGLNTGHSHGTPIIPVILGSSVLSLQMSAAMGRRGVNVQPILYPAVEERAARLRFFITSQHTEAQIRHTVDAVAEELHRVQSGESEVGRDDGGATSVFEAAVRR